MALLKIVHYPEPVLLTVGKPVGEEEFNEDLRRLVGDMFETMYAAGGVGLAAPQVAVSKRLFVMDCSGGEDASQKIALINPEIIAQEGEQTGDEGCLSFPGNLHAGSPRSPHGRALSGHFRQRAGTRRHGFNGALRPARNRPLRRNRFSG